MANSNNRVCNNCFRESDASGKYCPHCGAPMAGGTPRGKKKSRLLLAGVLVLAVLAALTATFTLGGGKEPNPMAAAVNVPESTATATLPMSAEAGDFFNPFTNPTTGPTFGDGVTNFFNNPTTEPTTEPTTGDSGINFFNKRFSWLGGEYVGQTKDDVPHGKGTLTWKHGSYTGSFANGYPEGRGTYSTEGARDLEGEWSYGSLSFTFNMGYGYGMDAGSYEGMLMEDWPAGYGIQYDPTGGRYVGSFRDGVPYGQGTYYYCDGSKLSGEWDHQYQDWTSLCPDRTGTDMYYTGPTCDGKRAGCGILEFDYCGTFYGEFRGGRVDGSGFYCFAYPSGKEVLEGDNWASVMGDKAYGQTYYGLKLGSQWMGWGIGIKSSGNYYVGEVLYDYRDGFGRVFLKSGVEDTSLRGVYRSGNLSQRMS